MRRLFCAALLPALLFHDTAAAALLTGSTRLSCEALLCLSSATRPGACAAALSRYFAIKKVTWPATFAARLKFLGKCPTGDAGLARVVAQGAGRCDGDNLVNFLNSRSARFRYARNETPDPRRVWRAMPAYCIAYFNHPRTGAFDLPEYRKVCPAPIDPVMAWWSGGWGTASRNPCYLRWRVAPRR